MIKELIEYIVKQIVEDPSQVDIQLSTQGEKSKVSIAVADKDRGKVIGREGNTINAIRSLVASVVPDGKLINIDMA